VSNDTAARWASSVARAEPQGDLRDQVRAFVRAGYEAGVQQGEIVAALQRWQYDHARFVDGPSFLRHCLDAVAVAPEELAPDWIDFPVVHAKGPHKGRPAKERLENSRALLAALGCRARYNLMAHSIELDAPALAAIAAERRANVERDWLRERANRYGLSKDGVCEHVSLLAGEYHPVRDWLADVVHDGRDRIADLVATVDSDDDLAPTLVRKWIWQCAAAVSGPSFRPVGVLVFVGPQGCGKTTWCERLAPPEQEWIGLGMHLDPSNRDSVQQLTRHWIAELGELDATFRRADVAALKAFVDRPADTYRSAYARREERIPRRTVLFASCNRPRFLQDDTGNRRWWCVRVSACDWRHGIDTRQLWRQALDEVRAGAQWRLTAEESAQLNASNARFESLDPLADEVWAAWSPGPADADVRSDAGWRSLAEILAALPGREGRPASKRDANAVAKLLRDAGARSRRSGAHRLLQFAVQRSDGAPAREAGWGDAGRFV